MYKAQRVTVLVEVRERYTQKVVIKGFEYSCVLDSQLGANGERTEYMDDASIVYYVKLRYSNELHNKLKMDLELKQQFSSLDWFIDACLLSRETLTPREMFDRAGLQHLPAPLY